MKKIKITLTAIIGLGLGFAHAEAFDFDGRSGNAASFMDEIKAVDVSQGGKSITPVPEKAGHTVPASPCALVCFEGRLTDDCQCDLPVLLPQNYCVSTSSGFQWWSCVLGGPVSFGGNLESMVAGDAMSPYRSLDQATIKRLTGYYAAQDELRKIVLAYADTHKDASLDILTLVQDAKTKILYDDKGAYVVNGRKLIVLSNRNLVESVKTLSHPRNKAIGLDDALFGVALTCASMDSCWGAIGDGVSHVSQWVNTQEPNHPNAPSDHDTYHNNHDGSGSNYEVNKAIK